MLYIVLHSDSLVKCKMYPKSTPYNSGRWGKNVEPLHDWPLQGVEGAEPDLSSDARMSYGKNRILSWLGD